MYIGAIAGLICSPAVRLAWIALQRVGQRLPGAQQLDGGRVSEMLALTRDRELQEPRVDRGEDHRGQRAEHSQRAFFVVATE